VVRHRDCFLAVQLDVLEEVLPVDEIEAQLRNGFVERVGQFSAHLSEQPVEGGPDGQGIGQDLALAGVVFDEIDESALRSVVCLTAADQLLVVKLGVVIKMENLLGKKWESGAVEVFLAVVVPWGQFTVGQYVDGQLGLSPNEVLVEVEQELGTVVDGVQIFD